jgi:hypothetical protein
VKGKEGWYGTVNTSALLVLSTVVYAKSIYLIVCICLSMQCPTRAREPPAYAWCWPSNSDTAEPSSAATPFGGITFVFGRDFKQILLVIIKGGRA